MASQFYERTALSRNKAAMLKKAGQKSLAIRLLRKKKSKIRSFWNFLG